MLLWTGGAVRARQSLGRAGPLRMGLGGARGGGKIERVCQIFILYRMPPGTGVGDDSGDDSKEGDD